jgi:hypothetical protein
MATEIGYAIVGVQESPLQITPSVLGAETIGIGVTETIEIKAIFVPPIFEPIGILDPSTVLVKVSVGL